MEEKVTCEKIVIDYLKSKVGSTIAHHDLDVALPLYGVKNYDKLYSPATYHRVFCWLKNEPETLRENGIELEQLVEGAGKVNKWKVNSSVVEEPFKMILE
ncbi:MAG: hypothetical protein A2W11_03740 [Ignavibacteria bacterium RBG_16_35_7]|nr:MAG: hypothetical protein A2W11_03740 [Ignavibacteria bacterium RBG_16_35_7]